MSAPRDGPASAEKLHSRVRLFARLLVFFPVTLALLPVQVALVACGAGAAKRFPRAYHRFCCRLFGIDVRRRGTASSAHPTLFVSNHVSYMDIVVLGSLIDAAFIAKAEVRRWPFFGLLAQLQRCVFVDRRGVKAAAQNREITDRLAAGDSLVLFPEGTSGDGRAVLPFKSALFAVAHQVPDGLPLVVQPVSIAYTRLDRLPLGRALRPCIAWYGGMTLMPHLLTLLGLAAITVEVRFHPPLELGRYASRKALADACRGIVEGGVTAARRPARDEAPQLSAPGRAAA